MSAPAHPIPLRLGTDAEFASVRGFLESAGYTEQAVAKRLGLEHISNYDLNGPPSLNRKPAGLLDTMIWFFLEGGPLSPAEAGSLPLDDLRALDLISPLSESGLLFATVMLHPLRGFWIASDRPRPREGVPARPPDDFVYPALVANTRVFLDLIPFGACDAFLDLCAGTGIAAMIAARSGARHAWSCDLTERCTHFAEFNCRLNGIDNVTASQGDLYEPAGDLTFDRIVAHPPYVPVYRRQLVFDSGGLDGEQVVRGIIQGLPRYLRPGGRFYALTGATDRDRPFEQRVRDWLGSAEAEFDVAFVLRKTWGIREYTAEAMINHNTSAQDTKAWRQALDELKVQQLVYGLLTLQRREKPRPVFTVRKELGPNGGPAEHAWLMEWETSQAEGGIQRILAARPKPVSGARLRVEHALAADGWVPETYVLEIDNPFRAQLEVQDSTAHLLACADGSLTVPELLDSMKKSHAVHEATPLEEFARVVAFLVSEGFLTLA